MAETYNGGITLTWPSAGEVDWVTVFRSFARTISDHDHTGGGRGTKISGGALSVDAFTGASFRLDFNEWLRSRNDLNTADVNILRITTGNEVEVGPPANFTTINADTINISEIRLDQLYVNYPAPAITVYPATIANSGSGTVSLNLTSPVGSLKFRLDAMAAPGAAITTEYYNNTVLKFTQAVDDTGILSFIPAGGQTIRFTANSLVPNNDSVYSLGASNAQFLDAYFLRTHTPSVDAPTTLNFQIAGATKLTLNSSGDLFPATDNTQALGAAGAFFYTVLTNKVQGNNTVDISGYGAGATVRVDSTGHIFPPFTTTQDVGTSTKPWRTVYTKNVYAPTADLELGVSGGSQFVAIGTGGHPHPTLSNGQDIGFSATKWRTGYFGTSVDTPAITGLNWTSWTPTITGDVGSPTINLNRARYALIGKIMHFDVCFTLPSGGSNSRYFTVTFNAITPAIAFATDNLHGSSQFAGPVGVLYWGQWVVAGGAPYKQILVYAYTTAGALPFQVPAGIWIIRTCGTVEIT